MKFPLAIFLFLTLLGDGLKEASRINNAAQEAEGMYSRGQYRQALALYQYLADSLQVRDEELTLNLAHAAYHAGDQSVATRNYNLLAKNTDPALRSIAFTQLGLIYFQKGNPERALYSFKQALIQNPMNETARFNYELVKKHLAANPSLARQRKRNPPPPQPGQKQDTAGRNAATRPSDGGQEGTTADNQAEGSNPPIDRPNAAGADNRGGAGPSGGRQPQPGGQAGRQHTPLGQPEGTQKGLSDGSSNGNGAASRNKEGTEAISRQEKQMQTLRARLKDSDLSPEKATQLLEALRQAELQYLQQLPRKTQKPRSDSRPTW
jgi:tetratricopeptide (TPR) repeat protein